MAPVRGTRPKVGRSPVVPQRVELKDYLDIHALLTKGGIRLAEMLAAGAIIYGHQFNPLLSLKALAYHDDFTAAELPTGVRHDLIEAGRITDLQKLPTLNAVRTWEAKS